MGGGGSDNPTYTAKNYNPADVAAFANTQSGQKFSPEQLNMLYTAYGVSQGPNGLGVVAGPKGGDPNNPTGAWNNVDLNLVNTFEGWVKSNQQSQNNWQNYADSVTANEGGEGDQTITSGAAQGQREALLGALANPNQPTQPTVALGVMGTLKKNGVAIPPGGKS
jgi:hypothetical protein